MDPVIRLLKIALFTWALCATTLFAEARPNIVLIVSDDHGVDALGAYGNEVIQTPHLDSLAKEGMRFENAYCTSASCAASRSVILTGKYGHATGSYGHVHDYHHFSTFEGTPSFPVLLSQAGYHTARIGKYHLAPESVYRFDSVLEADPRSTVEMAEACENIIRGDQPFFLYFCPDDPHRAYPFKPESWELPNNFGNRADGYPGVEPVVYAPDAVHVPPFLTDNAETRAEIAQYYRSVSRIDQGVGRLLEIVEEAGKENETIVIYISDNGIAFPGAKTTVYEPGIRLPCIIKNPLADIAGSVSDAFVSWVDLTPTLLDLAGISFDKKDFHGTSFSALLEGSPNADARKAVFAAHNFHELTMYYPMRVVRKDNYKLIWNIAHGLPYPFASDLWAASSWQSLLKRNQDQLGLRSVEDYLDRPEFELYDLASDPWEVSNLADDGSYWEVLNFLKEELKEFQKRTQDPWFIMWDNDASLQGTGVNL
ncbi:MAG: sulfatase family protein [Opitutales bacterium]